MYWQDSLLEGTSSYVRLRDRALKNFKSGLQIINDHIKSMRSVGATKSSFRK